MREHLDRLAAGGTTAVPVDQFEDLAEWTRDWCIATGDARFCVLSEMLRQLFEIYGEQGVRVSAARELDAMLVRELPGVLEADEAGSGAQLAEALRRAVLDLPLDPRFEG